MSCRQLVLHELKFNKYFGLKGTGETMTNISIEIYPIK